MKEYLYEAEIEQIFLDVVRGRNLLAIPGVRDLAIAYFAEEVNVIADIEGERKRRHAIETAMENRRLSGELDID